MMCSYRQPPDVLQEQKGYCLNTFVTALDRSLRLPKGCYESKRARELSARALGALAEIERIESEY